MKKLFYLLIGVCLINCSERVENDLVKQEATTSSQSSIYARQINDDEKIAALMRALETTIIEIKDNGGTEGMDLNTKFVESLNNEGYSSIQFEEIMNQVAGNNLYSTIEQNILNTSPYETENDYLSYLDSIYSDIEISDLEPNEKQMLNNTIEFQKQLVTTSRNLAIQYDSAITSKKSWWKRWGKCAAGIVGGGMTGGTVGCAGVGAVGALVGSVAPGAGTAAGAAAGCIGGGIVGAIGGGLTGAALFCD